MFWYVSEYANIRKYVSEHSWLSGWVIFSILAHLAYLVWSYFSLIFSAINTYNCSWFDLTNKKIGSDWRKNFGEKWPMLMIFFPTAIAAITGKYKGHIVMSTHLNWDGLEFKSLIQIQTLNYGGTPGAKICMGSNPAISSRKKHWTDARGCTDGLTDIGGYEIA